MLGKLIKGSLLFAAGAAVGAGALWLMSESGKETRAQLQDLADKAKDKAKEFCDQVKGQVKEQVQQAKQEMEAQDGEANPV